jgi:hypothetical protein
MRFLIYEKYRVFSPREARDIIIDAQISGDELRRLQGINVVRHPYNTGILDLNLSFVGDLLHTLPENMTVTVPLSLGNSKIKSLPKLLTAKSINIYNTKIKEIPKTIKVSGIIYGLNDGLFE